MAQSVQITYSDTLLCNQSEVKFSAVASNHNGLVPVTVDWEISSSNGFFESFSALPFDTMNINLTMEGVYTFLCKIYYDNLSFVEKIDSNVLKVSHLQTLFAVYQDGQLISPGVPIPCPPATFHFANLTESYFGIQQSSWQYSLHVLSIDSTFNHTFYMPGNHQITLITLDKVGCLDTAHILNEIQIEGPFLVSNVFEDVSLCGQDFTFHFYNSSNLTNALIDFGDGSAIQLTSLDTLIPKHYDDVKCYFPTYTIEDTNGCVIHHPIDTICLPPHGYEANLFINQSMFQVGEVVNFQNTSSSSLWLDSALYIVSFGDGSIDSVSGFSDFSHVYENPGEYEVELLLKSQENCTEYYSTSIIIIDEQIHLFPNPTDASQIHFYHPLFEQITSLTISDSFGTIIFDTTPSQVDFIIDVSSLVQGVYFLTYWLDGISQVEQFVVL